MRRAYRPGSPTGTPAGFPQRPSPSRGHNHDESPARHGPLPRGPRRWRLPRSLGNPPRGIIRRWGPDVHLLAKGRASGGCVLQRVHRHSASSISGGSSKGPRYRRRAHWASRSRARRWASATMTRAALRVIPRSFATFPTRGGTSTAGTGGTGDARACSSSVRALRSAGAGGMGSVHLGTPLRVRGPNQPSSASIPC